MSPSLVWAASWHAPYFVDGINQIGAMSIFGTRRPGPLPNGGEVQTKTPGQEIMTTPLAQAASRPTTFVPTSNRDPSTPQPAPARKPTELAEALGIAAGELKGQFHDESSVSFKAARAVVIDLVGLAADPGQKGADALEILLQVLENGGGASPVVCQEILKAAHAVVMPLLDAGCDDVPVELAFLADQFKDPPSGASASDHAVLASYIDAKVGNHKGETLDLSGLIEHGDDNASEPGEAQHAASALANKARLLGVAATPELPVPTSSGQLILPGHLVSERQFLPELQVATAIAAKPGNLQKISSAPQNERAALISSARADLGLRWTNSPGNAPKFASTVDDLIWCGNADPAKDGEEIKRRLQTRGREGLSYQKSVIDTTDVMVAMGKSRLTNDPPKIFLPVQAALTDMGGATLKAQLPVRLNNVLIAAEKKAAALKNLPPDSPHALAALEAARNEKVAATAHAEPLKKAVVEADAAYQEALRSGHDGATEKRALLEAQTLAKPAVIALAAAENRVDAAARATPKLRAQRDLDLLMKETASAVKAASTKLDAAIEALEKVMSMEAPAQPSISDRIRYGLRREQNPESFSMEQARKDAALMLVQLKSYRDGFINGPTTRSMLNLTQTFADDVELGTAILTG
ncbi:MAG: hypothetical protein EON92_03045 [Burkholderiales bacterium]|nr:MAG: hypothetical protein EON92_03045 [Burkholderiales bacterium]